MSETRFWLTEERLDPAAVARLVEDPGCGAVVTFVGNVRRDNEGRDVAYLEYEAYTGMAEAKMARSGAAPDFPELLARAEALVPVLRERAAQAGELRRIPDETIEDLHRTGLFRILQPKRVGGSELPFRSMVCPSCRHAMSFGARGAASCFHSSGPLLSLQELMRPSRSAP